MFAIFVVFNERGYWSKPYTYKSETGFEVGDVVVVPTGAFFSVGKVVKCIQNYDNFNPEINYKHIHCKVENVKS